MAVQQEAATWLIGDKYLILSQRNLVQQFVKCAHSLCGLVARDFKPSVYANIRLLN